MSNCKAQCGGVTVPLPLGTGAGCFLDDWYDVVCGAGDTVSRLKKLDLQEGLFCTYSSVVVNYPVKHSGSGGNRKESYKPVPPYGSPFTFSSRLNTFVAIRCDSIAALGNENPPIVKSRIQCTGPNTRSRYSECTGSDSCQTLIPGGLQGLSINFQRQNDLVTTGGLDRDCQSAFLALKKWFRPEVIDLYALRDGGFAPVALQWGIHNISFLRSLRH